MKMNKFKRLNKLQIISIILLLITLVLAILNVPRIKYLYWYALGLNLFSFIKFIDKWAREGKTGYKNTDKRYDNNLTRKSSEIIFFMLVAYGLVICATVMVDCFVKDYMYGLETIIGLFVFAIVWNYIVLTIVDKTYKEIVMLVKTNPKNNKERKQVNESKRNKKSFNRAKEN